jgi:hypothetical protein
LPDSHYDEFRLILRSNFQRLTGGKFLHPESLTTCIDNARRNLGSKAAG